MTIPGVDILGSKKGYSLDKPWMFEDFDQITFYRVSEEEYEKQMAQFNSGRYEYQWEEVIFDMAEHNRLLRDTKDEVEAIRARQREAQAEMEKIEAELLAKWEQEKAANVISMDTVDDLLQGEFSFYQDPIHIKDKLRLMAIDYRPRNPPHRSPPQRQRMEGPNPTRRDNRQRSSHSYPRSYETGDRCAGGGPFCGGECRCGTGPRQAERCRASRTADDFGKDEEINLLVDNY
jgi:hypothetical protein